MHILFAFNQSETLKSSIYIISNKYFILLLENNRLISSGNVTGFKIIKAICKSFVRSRNKCGSKVDCLGTAQLIFPYEVLFYYVLCTVF